MTDGYQAPGAPSGSDFGTTPTSDDKTLAIITHLLCLVSWFIGPLIVYLLKKDTSPFVRLHAAEALNFQLSILIYMIVSGLLVFLLIGIPLLFAVSIFNIVMIIIAAIKSSEGVAYRYPLCIRMVT